MWGDGLQGPLSSSDCSPDVVLVQPPLTHFFIIQHAASSLGGRFATAQREQALKLGKAAQRATALRAFSVLLAKLLEIDSCPVTCGKADTGTRLRHV